MADIKEVFQSIEKAEEIKEKKVKKLTYSIGELGEALGVSTAKAYDLVHIKGFPVIHVGKRMVIPIKELEEWVSLQAKKAMDGLQGGLNG